MSATRTVAAGGARPAYSGRSSAPPPPNQGAHGGQDQAQVPGRQDERAAEAARQQQRAFACEVEAFMKSLDDERATLRTQLPADIDVQKFLEAARMAVTQDVDLIKVEYRMSLFLALQKAAKQGLLPDKKEGALILRYNNETRRKEVCWQPMVWGVIKLARRTGDIRTFKAQIVYQDEPFAYISGEEDRIEHERIPACEAKGLNYAVGVYAIITARDGAKTRRWMSAGRVRAVKASSFAAKGPWHGPFEDEMWIKTILLFTLKWANTDASTAVFREAINDIQDSLEVDLDAANVSADSDARTAATGNAATIPAAPRRSRLDAIEAGIAARGAPRAIEHQQTIPATVRAADEREKAQIPVGAAPVEEKRAATAPQPQPEGGRGQVPSPSARRDRPESAPATQQRAAPQYSAEAPVFNVYVRDETGAPDNEGRPFTSPVEFAKWLAFLVAQVAPEHAKDAFRENQQAIDLAYALNSEAAKIIGKLGAQSKGATRAGGDGQVSSVELAATAQRVKDNAWATGLIEDQIETASSVAELDRRTVGSEALKIRLARYDRECPEISARIRDAYGRRAKALKGGAR